MELLRAFAYARGWVAASGLPDETRAGRRILKDYVDGKILYCKAPPGASREVQALAESAGLRRNGAEPPAAPPVAPPAASPAGDSSGSDSSDGSAAGGPEGGAVSAAARQQEGAAGPAAAPGAAGQAGDAGDSSDDAAAAAPGTGEPLDLDEGDLLLIDDLDIGGKKSKPVRPAYKVGRGLPG